MSRALPAGLANALAAPQVAPVFLVELDWPNGTVYAWNGLSPLTWGGQTWVGVGHLGGISEMQESNDLTANGVTLTMSGIPSAEVAEALRNDTQGRSAKIYFGVLNGNGFAIDPYLIFDGLIDAPTLTDDGTTATISLALEKEFIDNRNAARRYTDQDQQFDAPGDTFFSYVAALSVETFTWGAATVTAGPAAGSGTNPTAGLVNSLE